MDTLFLIVIIVALACLCIAFTYLFRHYFKTSINDINAGKQDIELIADAVDDDKKKKSKARKAWRITGKVLSWVILGIVLLFFAYSLYNRVSGNVTSFFGSSYIVIASGSMSEKNEANTYLDENGLDNQIQTYDLIGISFYTSSDEVQLYDVVAYRGLSGDTIVHRIISIDENGHYQTRGDANSASDTGVEYNSYLTYDSIIGYYNGFRIGGIGSIVIFFQSNAGIATVVALIYCYLMYQHYSDKYADSINDRTELLLDVLNYDLNDDPDVAITKDANDVIVYKGERYIFEDGEFLSKESISDPPHDGSQDETSSDNLTEGSPADADGSSQETPIDESSESSKESSKEPENEDSVEESSPVGEKTPTAEEDDINNNPAEQTVCEQEKKSPSEEERKDTSSKEEEPAKEVILPSEEESPSYEGESDGIDDFEESSDTEESITDVSSDDDEETSVNIENKEDKEEAVKEDSLNTKE